MLGGLSTWVLRPLRMKTKSWVREENMKQELKSSVSKGEIREEGRKVRQSDPMNFRGALLCEGGKTNDVRK